MTNAKKEFLHEVEGKSVLCAIIKLERSYDKFTNHVLPQGFSEAQLNSFLESIDFEYDSGYGGQELYGYVWYNDGTWSSRGEYDGSEWWEHNVVPEIPGECTANTKEQN